MWAEAEYKNSGGGPRGHGQRAELATAKPFGRQQHRLAVASGAKAQAAPHLVGVLSPKRTRRVPAMQGQLIQWAFSAEAVWAPGRSPRVGAPASTPKTCGRGGWQGRQDRTVTRVKEPFRGFPPERASKGAIERGCTVSHGRKLAGPQALAAQGSTRPQEPTKRPL